MYTIKQAAARSGLSIPVLRAWERRYGVVTPVRTPSGYRLYDDASIARLRVMHELVDQGWSPSTAAAALLAGTAPAVELHEAGASVVETDAGRQQIAADAADDRIGPGVALPSAFVGAAATLDADGLERVLDDMFAAGSFEVVVERHVLPALRALGDAWADGRVSVAGEHAASHAVFRRLAAAYQAAGRSAPAERSILVGLPPGARHELGALAFATAARRSGLPVVYLGPDLPVDDWVATARRVHARAAIIGAVTRGDGRAALLVGRALADAVPGIVVAFGGRASPDPGPSEGWPRQRPVILPDHLGEAVTAVASALRHAPS